MRDPGPEPMLDDCAADIERQRLFDIIDDLVQWENTTNETVLARDALELAERARRRLAEFARTIEHEPEE